MKKELLLVSLAVLGELALAADVPMTPAHEEYLARGIMGLIHFGPNTFADQEWGFGNTDPAVVQPTRLDPAQWISAMKAAEIKSVVMVAKHHDGFCLWPSKYNADYSMSAVPGPCRGVNVVKAVESACRREGLGFGVYVSPWDRHHADYATPAYVDYFHNQWGEFLSGDYGLLCETWFDGANGGDGWYGGVNGGKGERRKISSNYYRMPELLKKIVAHNPRCLMFGGYRESSIAWCGNERGILTNAWRYAQTRGGATHFMPPEADTPLRKGWFFHANEHPKPLKQMVESYFKTVGRGGVLNWGIAPNREGRVCDEDVQRLKEFGDYVRRFNAVDFAKNAEVARTAGAQTETVEFRLAAPVTFNAVDFGEDLTMGQRANGWTVEVGDGTAWKEVAKGPAVGYRRIARFDAVKSARVRITVSGKTERPKIVRPAVRFAEAVKDTTETEYGETDTAKWMTGKSEVFRTIDRYVSAGRIAGVVSVLSDADYNEQFDCVGWADVENKRKMTPETVFAVFSMTKTFLGAAMMCAIDEGKISLDDEVSKYLPEFADVKMKDGSKPRRPLTLRDMTSHMNGFRGGYHVVNRDIPLREVARRLAAQPLETQPGEKFSYGSATIGTAGACLEVAVGKPFEVYLKEKILDPLGMKDTTFTPNEEQVKRLVKAYTSDDKTLRPANDSCVPQLVFPKKAKIYPAPGGGLFSTPRDMIRFSQMLAHHGEWKGRRLISRKAFDTIFIVKQTPASIERPYTCGSWLWGDWFGHEGAMRTDQRANLKTGHSRVFFIQTENKAGRAFFQLKNDWHKACDKVQGTPPTHFGT